MKIRYILLLLPTLILGIVLVISGSLYKNLDVDSTPSEVVERYYVLTFDGKIVEALSLWTECSPNSNGVCTRGIPISGENTIEKWTKDLSKDKDAFSIGKVKLLNDYTATVLVHTKFPNGLSQRTIYKLTRINETWMLNGLSSPAMETAENR